MFPSHISFPDPNNKIIEIDKLPTQGNNEVQFSANVSLLIIVFNLLKKRFIYFFIYIFLFYNLCFCIKGASRRLTMARHEFQFDKVFSPSASQEVVFEEISQLVQVSYVSVFALIYLILS